jgi:hypothetical protein
MDQKSGEFESTSKDSDEESESEDSGPIKFLREFSIRFDSTQHLNRPVREMYPRLGWHDVHSKIVGLPARDLSSHFIQVSSR